MGDELLQLTNTSGKGTDPPATDMFFSNRARLKSNAFSTVWLGVSIGLAWAAVFFLASLVVGLGGGTVLDFFKALYPGFNVGTFIGIILGVAWSFLYAFIFGLLVGLVYNALLRGGTEDIESYDIYG